jgi:DNA-binding transcriptional regulator YdaS (Cro superfamily)
MKDSVLERVYACVGPHELGRALGITGQAVSQWDRVPPLQVLKVEQVTGIPRHELRPDIYPPPQPDAA